MQWNRAETLLGSTKNGASAMHTKAKKAACCCCCRKQSSIFRYTLAGIVDGHSLVFARTSNPMTIRWRCSAQGTVACRNREVLQLSLGPSVPNRGGRFSLPRAAASIRCVFRSRIIHAQGVGPYSNVRCARTLNSRVAIIILLLPATDE